MLKNLLKLLKLNESSISTLLGFVIIVILGLLVINFFRNQDQGTTFPEGAVSEIEEETGTHTVSRGETLWSIAQEYYNDGFKWEEIMKANDLTNPNQITEGQKLIIPELVEAIPDEAIVEAQKNPSPTPLIAELPKTQKETGSKTYTVVKGDNLWDIAVEVYGDGYKWVEIAKANKLANPDVIHAGNVFMLP